MQNASQHVSPQSLQHSRGLASWLMSAGLTSTQIVCVNSCNVHVHCSQHTALSDVNMHPSKLEGHNLLKQEEHASIDSVARMQYAGMCALVRYHKQH
jgi:hypothetical protein